MPASEPPEGTAIRINVVSDIHGAAEQLRMAAAGTDVLLVCGDLLNLIDYGSLQGIMADVYGPEATRRFAQLRTAGRFDEAGMVLRQGMAGREAEVRTLVRAASRAQYEAVFAAFPERTYLTHGNADFPEQFRDLLRPGIRHLDGEAVDVDGMRVGFVGGGLPRGSRPHLSEVHEGEFAAKVARLPRVDVLCSHMPPMIGDLCFDVVAGRPEPGSQALLDYVEEHQPDYLYFGHVHQPRASRMRIGQTRLVNVGHFRATGRLLQHPVE
ncbi:MAG TPA: metallophosphoesterase [Actinomycetota bacterium]|nr:metallophosphoesterase [Actinomycetota bacterium]